MARNSPTLGTSSSYVASTLSDDFQVFCCKLHANTPVGSLYVKTNKSVKVEGKLGFPQKTKSPSGATAGGIPQKNGHIFSQKIRIRKRAKYNSTLGSSEFRRDAGGQAERTPEPETAYTSVRTWPFSPASGPASCLRNRTSPTQTHPCKGKIEQHDKRNKKHYSNLQVFKHLKKSLVYLHDQTAQT
jgi:hypothetical protein